MPFNRSKLFSTALDSVMQERGINQTPLPQRARLAVSRVNNCRRTLAHPS